MYSATAQDEYVLRNKHILCLFTILNFLRNYVLRERKKSAFDAAHRGRRCAHFHHVGALFTKLMSPFGTKKIQTTFTPPTVVN